MHCLRKKIVMKQKYITFFVLFSSQVFAAYGTLVWHSQNKPLPPAITAPDFVKVYDGYSQLGLYHEYNRRDFKNLSEAASCVTDANVHPTPFTICQRNGCDYGNSMHTSDWLTNDNPENKKSTTSPRIEYSIKYNAKGVVTYNGIVTVKGLISTCSVFQTKALILTRHSQSNSIPDCPSSKWVKLWEGYSYAGSAWRGSDVKTDSPQDLGSSGSCLPEFIPHPVLSCWTGDGINDNFCQHARGPNLELTNWLAALRSIAGRDPVSNDKIVSGNQTMVSRCVVCAKN